MYDDASNHVSAQLVRVNQPTFVSDDWQEATPEEMIDAWPNYFGHFGTFSVDEAAATVTHYIQSGWFPNLVDTEQIRHYLTEDERLVLDADTAWGKVRIIWRKLAAAV